MSSFAKFGGTLTSTNVVGLRVSQCGLQHCSCRRLSENNFDHAAWSGRHMCGQHVRSTLPKNLTAIPCHTVQARNTTLATCWKNLGTRKKLARGERCFRASSFAGWHAEAHGHQDLGHNHGHNRFDTRGSPP